MTNQQEVLNVLMQRRSIRKYKPDQITDEELQLVLEAGRYAPSGANQQAAFVVVVQNAALRAQLSRMNAAVMGNRSGDPYYGAPTIILSFAEAGKATPVEDACLSLGNMFNAAFALGLGSCWIHRTREMFQTEEGKALLKEWGVPENCIGVGSCILGYPDCAWPTAAPRKQNFATILR